MSRKRSGFNRRLGSKTGNIGETQARRRWRAHRYRSGVAISIRSVLVTFMPNASGFSITERPRGLLRLDWRVREICRDPGDERF
jgi:hypothetical protein